MVHVSGCSTAMFATRDTFIDEQVPFIVMAATLDKITTPLNHCIFASVPTGTVDGESMIHFVQSMPNVKRVAIVHHTDEWANAKLDAIRKALSGGIGLHEVLDRNASDATAQVLKVKVRFGAAA
jgi:branched-chain amino acid transport system substrate-binding protein